MGRNAARARDGGGTAEEQGSVGRGSGTPGERAPMVLRCRVRLSLNAHYTTGVL